MAAADDTSQINPSSDENMSNNNGDDDDALLSITNEIINVLSLDDSEHKNEIVNDFLEDGRQSLVKYKEDIIPKVYKEVMSDNDNTLIKLFKKYIETDLEKVCVKTYPWLISFLEEYRKGENHEIYDCVFTRTANYGATYMKDCPILSFVLQLLFEGIDDECLKETNVFDDLWFAVTNDGLKSITKYSAYIVKSVMNEQLKRQSILFQVLREYYREDVFLSLKESNITDKKNLYELALDDVAEQGWLSDLKSIEESITPKSYKAVLEKLRSFHQKQKSKESKKSDTKEVHQTKPDSQSGSTSTKNEMTSKEKQNDFVWSSITCDGCRMKPLIGERYRCETCGNYDLCAKCQEKGHEHELKLVPKSKGDNETKSSLFYGMDAKEKDIFTRINQHRRQYGLPSLEPSVNLAYVAHTHAVDVVENSPDVNGGNMHSWSNKGKWKPVTYTPDHRYGQLMWSKPSEISNYKFDGFEISFGPSKRLRETSTVNPTEAVNCWKNSPGHNAVMVQQGIFHHPPMKAMGVGVYKGYACVWFGQEKDTFPAPS
ncbi:unnamed protein product [Rotaria sp. Silwood1]|nr:unnamed protein product [Rotaria sp. Silwood1]